MARCTPVCHVCLRHPPYLLHKDAVRCIMMSYMPVHQSMCVRRCTSGRPPSSRRSDGCLAVSILRLLSTLVGRCMLRSSLAVLFVLCLKAAFALFKSQKHFAPELRGAAAFANQCCRLPTNEPFTEQQL